jgi:hypothetical protein
MDVTNPSLGEREDRVAVVTLIVVPRPENQQPATPAIVAFAGRCINGCSSLNQDNPN